MNEKEHPQDRSSDLEGVKQSSDKLQSEMPLQSEGLTDEHNRDLANIPPVSTQRRNQSSGFTDEFNKPARKWWRRIQQDIPTWSMMLINLFLAIFTYQLFKSAIQQTSVAQNSLEVLKESLTPYIGLDDEINSIQESSIEVYDRSVKIRIKNFGNGNAGDVQIASSADRRLDDFSSESVIYENKKRFPVIAAGDTKWFFETIKTQFSQIQEDSISSSPDPSPLDYDPLFVHLRITYKALGDSFVNDIGIRVSDDLKDYISCKHNSVNHTKY